MACTWSHVCRKLGQFGCGHPNAESVSLCSWGDAKFPFFASLES